MTAADPAWMGCDFFRASPHNLTRAIGEIIFVGKRRENAGILDVFQVFTTHFRRK